MKPLSAAEIIGNWATLLLPVNQDDTIDFTRLEEEIDVLMAVHPDGIYAHGTAGEFYNLTEREFLRISEMLAHRCEKAQLPFQLGVSHPDPRTSLARLRAVIPLRPSAVQVILPDWFPVNNPESVAYLQRMAELADPVGLILYNPPHAKRVLSPLEIGRLKTAVPGLVGVKVLDGDETWYADMRRHARDLSLFVPGHHLATGFRLGAHGSYSNVACLNPLAAQRWMRQIRSDLPAALEVESRLCSFMDTHIAPYIRKKEFSNQAADKLLAAIGQWADIGPRLRWPYRGFPAEETDRLRPIARKILPEFFPPQEAILP